jgi:TatD DNase family protein
MLIETDCPYLTPTPFRGKRNEPRHVAQVAHRIADLRGLTFDQLAEATSRNAATLFQLPSPPANGV